MKISIIVPCSNISHYGVRSLSSYLKANGHEVELLFVMIDRNNFKGSLSKKSLKEIEERVQSSKLIGLSVMTNFLTYCQEITSFLKENLNIPIVWGGIHATIDPEDCLKYVDIVCIGEGERTFLDLVNKIERRKPYYKTKSLWVRTNNLIIKNDIRPLIKKIDNLPEPDYDLSSQYVLSNEKICKITREILKDNLIKMGDKSRYSVFTTRGCSSSCYYCCNYTLHKLYKNTKGSFIRKRNIDKVIEETRKNVQKFVFESVCIQDENFLVRSQKEIEEFADKYKKTINLPFQCEFSPLMFNSSKIQTLIKAGLCRVQIGIQSANIETNTYIYNRHYNRDKINQIIKFFSSYPKIICNLHFIVHNPWEKDDSLIETIKFISDLPENFNIKIYPLVLYPNTQFYNRAIKEGIIKDKYKDIVYKDWSLDRIKDSNYLNLVLYIISFLRKEKWSIGKISVVAEKLTSKKYRKILENPLIFKLFKKLFCYIHNKRGEGRV